MFRLTGKMSLLGAIVAAIAASLCCAAPLALLAMGISGSWLANLTLFEPLRPLFTGLTLLLLGLAWRRVYRENGHCESGACQTLEIPRQRQLFWLVAIPALMLLAFPVFAPLFY